MQGKKLRIVKGVLESVFSFDQHGALIPNADHLRTGVVAQSVERQLRSKIGVYKRLTDMYWRTDGVFADNPYGNSPTSGAGISIFGKRPLNVKYGGRYDMNARSEGLTKELEGRQRRIEEYQREVMSLHDSIEPVDKDSVDHAIWRVEAQQMMTGGGFDGNSIGEVHKSGLTFISSASKEFEFANTEKSALVVEAALWMKNLLMEHGLKLGSLEPMGAQEVRVEQDKDGMMGFPVFDNAFSVLERDIATRLLLCSGVDTRHLVGSSTQLGADRGTKCTVVDALAYILDNTTADAFTFPSVVTLLARIQKHGWKMEGGELRPKPGKTRSIYPNAALAAIQEAMTFSPFLNEVKDKKVPFFPSLQPKEIRVDMMKKLMLDAATKAMTMVDADWSKFDTGVKGGPLATIIYYAVRPFYKAEWQGWVDLATVNLTYKYLVLSDEFSSLWPNELKEAQKAPHKSVMGFTVYGLTDGLISGAKFTHVGGCLYGMCVFHNCIPKQLGWPVLPGVQAGDDTGMFIPISEFKPDDVPSTYTAMSELAQSCWQMELNASKQNTVVAGGELVVIFLQENYNVPCDIWGVGTTFRPLSALFFSEREKGLSVPEQLMVQISRMNQGADSPFIRSTVDFWLSKERMLASLFKEYGVNAFQVITDSIGLSLDELLERLDIGSFTFGVDRLHFETGELPILPVMAEVSESVSGEMPLSQVFKLMKIKPEETPDAAESSDVLDLEVSDLYDE